GFRAEAAVCAILYQLKTAHEMAASASAPPARPPARPPGSAVGICAEFCIDDNDCGPDSKCCSNGCGHECFTSPVPAPPGTRPPVFAHTQRQYIHYPSRCCRSDAPVMCCQTTCGAPCIQYSVVCH
uniref:WAP domain-containing protein n=1 Tax=Callorhinchus milii TaxID=7868 RepID=A0A4W3JTX0_CALMI